MTRRDKIPNAALHREEAYIHWLMRKRGLLMDEAIAYATKGQKGLDLHRAVKTRRERPQGRVELAAAREADLPEDVRRWRRIDRPCPRKGCIYPVHHSGPCRVVADFGAGEAADDFDKRFE